MEVSPFEEEERRREDSRIPRTREIGSHKEGSPMGMLDQRGEVCRIKYSRADRPILERTGTMASGVIRSVREETVSPRSGDGAERTVRHGASRENRSGLAE
jgi:hypothetical protein